MEEIKEADEFLTKDEEKACDLCAPVVSHYQRRNRLISDEHDALGLALDPRIKSFLRDLKHWLNKIEL